MSIVFFGTPEFAAYSLDELIKAGFHITCVVTARDQMGGRGGKQILESPVKKLAEARHIPILQPANLKSPEFIESLKSYNADVFIVVAFRMLPEAVWSMPPLGSYNLHGSLLPKYRGAAPIHWAVIRGEVETGVTVFKLKHEIDTGNILLQERIPIYPDDNTGMVHDRMKIVGAEVLIKAIKQIAEGPVFIVQDEKEVSHAPKIFHDDCKIDFGLDTREVYNFIRGMNPYPAPWTSIDGTECKILDVEPVFGYPGGKPGDIITDNKKTLKIKTTDGAVQVHSLKMAGKKAMRVHEFLSGHQIKSLSVGD